MEMKHLKGICGMTVRHRIRIEEIIRRVGVQVDLSGRVERHLLSWFGYLKQ